MLYTSHDIFQNKTTASWENYATKPLKLWHKTLHVCSNKTTKALTQDPLYVCSQSQVTHVSGHRVGRNADGRWGIRRSTRQALEELLGDEGHDGMQQSQAGVQTGVEHIAAHSLGLLAVTVHHWFDVLLTTATQHTNKWHTNQHSKFLHTSLKATQ